MHILLRKVTGTNGANRRNKKLIIKSNTPLRPSKSKIKSTFIDNAENLDIDMLMYNFWRYLDLPLINFEIEIDFR